MQPSPTQKCLALAGALLAFLLCGGCRDGQLAAQTAPSAPEKSLEQLLLDNKLQFLKQDGIYKVILSDDKNDVAVTCGEATMYEDRSGRPVRMIWLWTQIASIPPGAEPPPAMLKKIASINDGLRPGNIGLHAENGGVYYNSSLWLDTATPQTLYDELAYAFYRKGELQALLLPYLQEE